MQQFYYYSYLLLSPQMDPLLIVSFNDPLHFISPPWLDIRPYFISFTRFV